MSARNRRHRHKGGASQDSFELHENENGNDDGGMVVDADELFGEHRSRRRGAGHKDEQLCQQAFEILTVAMADLGDEVLRELSLESVQMGPDAARLLVTFLAPAGRESPADVDDVMARLAAAKGALRSEIAAGIHRKRTPELSFRVMTRAEVER